MRPHCSNADLQVDFCALPRIPDANFKQIESAIAAGIEDPKVYDDDETVRELDVRYDGPQQLLENGMTHTA